MKALLFLSIFSAAAMGEYALRIQGPAETSGGTCTEYVIDFTSYGEHVALYYDYEVNVTTANNGAFYSDANCENSTSTATMFGYVSEQESYAHVWFKDAVAETETIGTYWQWDPEPITMEVTINGEGGTSGGTGGGGNGATQLQVTGDAEPVAVYCYAYEVSSLNANNEPVNVTQNTVVNLTGAGTFHTDMYCQNQAISEVTIENGTSSKAFYYLPTVSGAGNIGASSEGLTSGSLNLNVLAGPPHHVKLEGPTTLPFNTCTKYTASLRDEFGNQATTGMWSYHFVLVNYRDQYGWAQPLYSDSNCANQSNGALYMEGSDTSKDLWLLDYSYNNGTRSLTGESYYFQSDVIYIDVQF